MEDLARDLAVVEGQHLGANDLVRFVSLACDHDGVAGASPVERCADGGSPLDLAAITAVTPAAPDAHHDLVEDGLRAFRARIVRRDPDAIGEARSNLTHDRPLAAVAIAAAAEDDAEATSRQLARGCQHALERVGGMRVVDDDQERLARAYLLEPPGHGADGAERPRDRRRLQTESQPHAHGAEEVHDVVLTDQRTREGEVAASGARMLAGL